MTRLWSDQAEHVITLKYDRRGHLISFTWQGHTHVIQQVCQRWQVDSDWWSEDGQVSREYWAVTTKDGLLCVFYYDLLDQRWYIAKVYD